MKEWGEKVKQARVNFSHFETPNSTDPLAGDLFRECRDVKYFWRESEKGQYLM